MATTIDGHKQRWAAIRTGIPFNPDAALVKHFCTHPEMGSPIGKEIPIDGGGVVQAFTGGTYRWTSENGVELVLE